MSTPIDVPDRLNMAQWFLDARLDESLKIAEIQLPAER